MTTKVIWTLLCCLALIGCNDSGASGSGLHPAMEMKILFTNASSVTLDVKTVNSTHVRVICTEADGDSPHTAESTAAYGTIRTGTEITVDELSPSTAYTLYAVACDDEGRHSALHSVTFNTDNEGAAMYPWEREREDILSFTDLVLCYGGSRHRTPFLWEKERFEPFVTYVDQSGTEHWLFDGFLMIEFVSLNRPDGKNYSYMVGATGSSAPRPVWEELIDYWFGEGNGVSALDEAIAEAAGRLGEPPFKRRVVMTMPDPIIFQEYADTGASTTYWGELDGQQTDFSSSADRIAVYKWFINEVRRRFDQGNYRYLELAGFYPISEEMTAPDDGWNPELKNSHEVIPPVAAYLHSLNQSLSWIPYNRAAGYTRWKRYGVDYAYMQPNYFWNGQTRPLSQFFSDIVAHDLAMEFEFDEELLDGRPGCELYKARFREYMEGAKTHGIYGTKPLSYYQGTNVLYDLWVSGGEEDRRLFHEFCTFVIENPLRK